MVISLNNSHTKLRRYISIGYSTIETKEVARIGYNGFLFPHEYSGEGVFMYLYNNTSSNAIVNAASDITYRPIEADDTDR
jgi:hypothetical protein